MKYAAFLRGINVGGIVLKMEDVKSIFTGLEFRDIQTYIQSGNIVFKSSETKTAHLEKRIHESILSKFNLDIVTFVKTQEQMLSIISNSPFGKNFDEKRLYVTFLAAIPSEGNLAEIKAIRSDQEKFLPSKDIIYSFYGNGYGKSKYTNNYFEKILDVSATTRNWNTISRISDIMNAG